MKWLFSAHRANRRFLHSQQYHFHFHGGSCPRLPNAPNPTRGWSNSFDQSYSTDSLHSYRSLNGTRINKVDLEIISREIIKPTCPTPHNLRTFNLSLIDQMMFDIYFPLILFLPNNETSVTDVVTKRSKRLKDALSEILTRFYPLAGEVKDNMHIECNDKGVYYIEARVNQTLVDFLSHPDDEKVRKLIPENPRPEESSTGNYIIGIQLNVFSCGGIGISSSLSHKIFDAYTYFMFMKAWTAAARGSPETISPSFTAAEVFPNHPCLNQFMPTKLASSESLQTKRFVFDSMPSSFAGVSRMQSTTAVIWKAAVKAASTLRPFRPESTHVLLSAVNIRKRASPPLPDNSFGNLVDAAGAICFPESQPELATLMGEIRESIAKIDSDYIESKKGEKGHEKILNEILGRSNQLTDAMDGQNCLFASSLLNSGVYEMDFGWGKPIWFYNMSTTICRTVILNDTLKAGGVEATVALSEDEMELFERDPEVLSYATADPSPLQFLDH